MKTLPTTLVFCAVILALTLWICYGAEAASYEMRKVVLTFQDTYEIYREGEKIGQAKKRVLSLVDHWDVEIEDENIVPIIVERVVHKN